MHSRSPYGMDRVDGDNCGIARERTPADEHPSRPTPRLNRDGYEVLARRPREARPGDVMPLDRADRYDGMSADFPVFSGDY